MKVSFTGLVSLYLISPYFTFTKHAILTFIFFYLVSNEKMARTEPIALRDQLYNAQYAQQPSVVPYFCVRQ